HVQLIFFFSSRRRHTRSKRDWSSDVCSSDLGVDGFEELRVSVCDEGSLPAAGLNCSCHFVCGVEKLLEFFVGEWAGGWTSFDVCEMYVCIPLVADLDRNGVKLCDALVLPVIGWVDQVITEESNDEVKSSEC